MTDIEQKGTLEFCIPKFLFCCEELPFVRMHIFSVKAVSGWMKMKKTLVGILVFDMIMGMLCLWAGGKRQDTTAPASQEVSTGKIAEEEDVAKKIALTFDDGPHPRYTEQLLDGLKERNVVATFFVTGENAQNYPNIIRREQEEGHLIGNHTYSHIQLTSGNRETFREELVKTNEILENITGEKVSFVRPPYGSWDKSFEKELNMFPVLWNIDPLDWCSHNAECIAAKVVEKAGDGDIILMHDYYDTSVTAALEVVDVLQKRGFQFVTVEEILFD
jgi:peptidoglycan/xylan/chitin deacetylase (PgdA/CDA1 family)